MRPGYWILMIIAALGWGWGGIGTRVGYAEGLGAWTLVAVRITIAAVLVLLVLIARRSPKPNRTDIRYGAVQALFNLAIPYVLFTFAYDEASAGFVGLLAALIPLSTSVYANFLLPDEPLTFRKAAALFVAFTGVAALLLSGDSGLSEGGRPFLAVGLGLTSVASIGYAAVNAKRYADDYDPIMITGLQFGLATPFLIMAMLAIEGAPSDVTAKAWWVMVSLAVASTFMPFLIHYWLLQHIAVTDASLIGYMVPIVALVGGMVLLDEQLQAGIVIGGALIVVGLVLSDRESRRAGRQSLPAEA